MTTLTGSGRLADSGSAPGAQATGALLGGQARRAPATRLGVIVVHDLVSAIVTGEVPPGSPLPPESELSAHFGVSRTVVRESVKRLEEKGMVRVVQGRGTEVTPVADWNILDSVVLTALIDNDESLGILDELAVIRSQLESVMAEAAATKRDAEDLTRLTEAHDTLSALTGKQDEFASADVEFHALIMKISGNRLAQGIARTLVRRATDNSRFYGAPGPDAVELTVHEHQRILDAIAAGDGDAAADAMAEHITQAWARRRLPRED